MIAKKIINYVYRTQFNLFNNVSVFSTDTHAPPPTSLPKVSTRM